MSLREAVEVVTQLAQKRVIESYAIAGAVAALNYIDPILTEDLDILISIDGFERHSSGLLLLGPIELALAEMGYSERTDLVRLKSIIGRHKLEPSWSNFCFRTGIESPI